MNLAGNNGFFSRTARDINEHIVGGAAPTEQVKTVVAILNHGRPVCSGTVIDNTWVISAGHCFTDANLDDMEIVAGEMDMRAYFQGFSTTAKTVGLKKLHLPENYWRIPAKVIENDVALVELTESLQINKNANIQAAALPPPGMKIAGENFTVVGWGKQGQYSPQSPSLLSIEVTIRQDQDCLTTHGVTNFLPNRMFCGGSKTGTTCNGDSGGGAVFHGWGVPVILGVVSFGKGTACDTPTVYTRDI
jgi:trypsin